MLRDSFGCQPLLRLRAGRGSIPGTPPASGGSGWWRTLWHRSLLVSRGKRKEEASVADKAAAILAALGGAGNIVEIEPCITRLRCELEDGSVVDEPALKKAGAHGVMRAGNTVQVVVGPEADTLASDIEDLMSLARVSA